MSISMAVCKQAHLVSFPPSSITIDSFKAWRRKEKVVVVMGATGTGKSRLSIDLATRFPSEIINSDKMQVYEGLDIVTNKVTIEETCGIPHHLLGVIDPDADFTSSDFCRLASKTVESIMGKNRLPIIAGGSNSYIEALVYDEESDFRSRYDCCFLWVDVALPVLNSFVSERVDRMVEAGLVDEVRRMFKADADYTRGIRRAIGVPEMDKYLRNEAIVDEESRVRLLKKGIDDIKDNTIKLADRQLQKIHRLVTLLERNVYRIDATNVFLSRGREVDEAWKNLVSGPSSMIVERFLCNDDHRSSGPTTSVGPIKTTVMGTVPVAAATH